jgi:signal transduction histidine kinase
MQLGDELPYSCAVFIEKYEEKEKIDSLFKPFSQVTFARREKGTGLGLYISRAILNEHDGRIWLNSEVGKGTSVFFTLPIHKKEDKHLSVNQTLAN